MKGERYMDGMEVQNILIEILYTTINDIKNNDSVKQKITPDILLSIYQLAKKHDLAHIVFDFIYRNKIKVCPKLQEQMQQEKIMSVYRHELMVYTYEEICNTFNEAKIAYIPLKGSVIRPYYPYESMRTSCDIDILIHEEDIKSAVRILETRGYCFKKRNYHDVSLYSPNKIHLELHFNIQENMDNLDAILKDAWEYAVPVNSTQYAFSTEFFAFHIFAHMAYHFVSGGCGVRSLLDIWIMEHKMGISHSCAKGLLQKAGIYQFSSEMSKLAELCFTHNKRDVFFDSVLKYIFQGGIYGSRENRISISKSKNNSSMVYALKRLFLPYKSMIILYPVLKKAPYLLPICWLARWTNAIFNGKSKSFISEMSCVNNTSAEKIKEIVDIRSRLGL
ncbi:MAG: hypothetical protein E7410_06770 [Ruminococcaceae bacterium]|nr:hypothetical protein [Oscillospiraceae bacterium]